MLRLIAIFFVLSLLFRRPRYHRRPPFMGWGMGFPFMGGCHHHHHYHHHGPYGMF